MDATHRHLRPDTEPRSAVLAEAVRRAQERRDAARDRGSYRSHPQHCTAPYRTAVVAPLTVFIQRVTTARR
jgi:hypothetical protein